MRKKESQRRRRNGALSLAREIRTHLVHVSPLGVGVVSTLVVGESSSSDGRVISKSSPGDGSGAEKKGRRRERSASWLDIVRENVMQQD